MLGVVLALSLLGADIAAPAVSGIAGTGACAGVVDRTDECPSPTDVNDVNDVVAADPKTPPPAVPGIEPRILPGELAFVSLGLALGGTAAIAWSYANTAETDDERVSQEVARWSGAGMLVWSGLTGAGAISLWVFDPSTGHMRPNLLEGQH